MFADVPLPKFSADIERRFKDAVRTGVVSEGRASYMAGLTMGDCPAFIDSDMAADWRIGWSWGHSDHFDRNRRAAMKRCPPGCFHRR